jgi:hypothetical protein
VKLTAESRQAGKWTFYNLSLASGEGKEPFITIKDCRIIDGSKGRFISFPARKDDAGKFWPHVWADDAFQVAAIKAMDAASPRDTRTHAERKRPPQDDFEDAPW